MLINLSCRINDTSYGLVGLNWLKSLSESGNDITYWPIEDIDRVVAEPQNVKLIQDALNKRGRYHVNAPSVRHCHADDLACHIGKGLHVGSTVFELTKLKPDQLHHLKNQDMIITASEWGKRILEENGVAKPIGVVPHGVDRTIFNENIQIPMRFDGNPTTFINVSKKEVRKGHIELIEAFNGAFTPKDNVLLVMCWHNRFYSKEENDRWDSLYKKTPMGSRVQTFPEFLKTQSEIAKLYAMADCGIFPSKAEGFGLGPLEMMSHGKQVILTNYSGHTEFATPSNSLLIEVGDLESAHDGFWFKGEGEWAAIEDDQIEQMIVHMRNVHKRKQEGNSLLNAAGIETAKQFSWPSATEKLVKLIE